MTSPVPTSLRVDGRRTDNAHGPGTTSSRRSVDRFIALASERRSRLSWVTPLDRHNQQQTAFVVRASTGLVDPRSNDGPHLFDSGAVESSDPFVELDTELDAHELYAWTVQVRDETGEWSEWAEPSRFETGPWTLDDWSARWVSHPPLTVLRRRMHLDGTIERARLHLTAQGLVRASVNGVAVNADCADPSRTDLCRALYRSYDVTDLVIAGENSIDFALGLGEWARSGEDPRLLGELVAHAADGTIIRAGTGPEMTAAASEITHDEPFYLERHERTVEEIDFDTSDALCVCEANTAPSSFTTPPAIVTPDPSPAVHRVSPQAVTEVTRSATSRVYDVGTNIAGRTRITLLSPLPPDAIVRVIHGEHLDENGRLDTTNLTMPFDNGRVRQVVEYLAGPFPHAICEPWFAYHGFRYVEILGLPSDAQLRVEAWSLHSDLESISELKTDDSRVAALSLTAQRTLLNNLHGIPEDCPTREQSGWTGDTASAAEFSFSAFDMQAFFTKWLADLRTSQQSDGSIPAISPDIRRPRISPDPVWGGALQRVLLNHWLHYGDERVVRETLPALRDWADYQWMLRGDDGVIDMAPHSYGSDWLALTQTPPPLHHTGAVIDCLESLALLEEDTGDSAAAAIRREQADGLRRAARAAFYDADRDVFGNGTQAANAIAVESAVLSGAAASRAADRIAEDVSARGDRLTSGFATTRTTVRALARTDHSQSIFDSLHQSAEPGIGAMLHHGPGTFWECWWIDPGNTGTGSLDHIGLGGPVAGWAWQWLAGVRPVRAGWSRFAVEPQFVTGIDTLSLTTHTVRGKIHVRYWLDGREGAIELTVPVSAEAVLRLAGRNEEVLRAGTHTRRFTIKRRAQSSALRNESSWHSPYRPDPSPDVVGERDWLSRALAADSLTAIDALPIATMPAGLHCMPVPHEQPEGPVALVQGTRRTPATAVGPGTQLSARFPVVVGVGADRRKARFVYAMLDLCLKNPARAMESFIIVNGADGSIARGVGTIWPAGWNRVSVDVTRLSASTTIASVEVGVRVREQPETAYSWAADDDVPLAFQLGETGFSTVGRTW
ncbi:family 78 glycoside hydrolase catalytic domain [Paramicrobacterium chengjingii]|uniref:alpha-L-rhamnosidase n=1 Tax=Paramicrobacterium chengjingii TaxID=2769067 RepID=A0ABX6YKJ7_9MICO|nr:family 78 glycoside hydrolase catalytic domain [Microbacterium chengjingii]QPZ38926.1 family 78 glycoside hydrolase catalytic domain [Microbacterium chengjingii]